jgi:putative Mg2+ transporter-C (MgtC) family protein
MINVNLLNADMVKIMVSMLIGAIIGLEREVSDKSAGLRTNILICVGAAVFTVVSVDVFDVRDAHIVAQIVTGIGFLGAGAIMRDGERVVGLTTAATIWSVAALGMTVGFGYFALAFWVSLLILFVQLAFTQLDIMIDDWRERHTFKIVSKLEQKALEEIHGIFRESKVRVMRRKLMKKNNLYYSEWFTAGGRLSQEDVMKKLLHSSEVLEVTY